MTGEQTTEQAAPGTLPVRPDLRSLDSDALAALANRGLVKRAAREIEREPPRLSADGSAVVAEFGDGVRTTLPEGGLERGRCSCGALGVCRHLIGLILTYQCAPLAAAPGLQPVTPAGEPGAAAPGEPSAVEEPTGLSGPAGSGGSAGFDHGAGKPAGSVTGPGPAASSGDLPGDAGPLAGTPGPDQPGRAAPVLAPAVGGSTPAPSENLIRPRAGGPVPASAGVTGQRVAWSPGEFSDDDLVARIGARLVTVARRAERAGYMARVRRGPVPVVELPAATVRFLVPHDLGYVHTDARAGIRDDVIALAVWAFRTADDQQPDVTDCVVDVGGSRGGDASAGSGLEAVVEFAAEVLRAGAVHAGAGLAGMAAARLTALERAGLRWPLDAATELAAQLTAYRDRSARYSPEQLADLIAELFARDRAITAHGGAAARARVLGSEEAAETPLRRVRLDGLGARVTATEGERRIEIFHGQPASGVVLVSHRQWTTTDDGPALSRRRIAGTTVGAVASGALVTESAVRNASRTVRLSASRIARSTVTVSNGAWDGLPPGLLIRDYAALAAELDAMPPRPVRARVRAELVRVLAVAEVGDIHYSPGSQRLAVEIRDTSGNTATVLATHAAVTPGRLDAVTAAFDGRRGRPRFVAGSVHRTGGAVVIDPYAIAADGPPVVPDLTDPATLDRPASGLSGSAEHLASELPGSGVPVPGDAADPLTEAVAAAREVLAEAAHSGLAHLSSGYPERLRSSSAALAGVGLHRVAAALGNLAARLSPDPGAEACRAWVDAYLRVSLAADLL